MRILSYPALCFILMLLLCLAAAFANYMLSRRKSLRFIERMRKKLQKQYPYLDAEKFTPIITMQSPCCRAMMWWYWNIIDQYFCDHCGKRYIEEYDWSEKKTTGKLEPANELDLSALNEIFKQWAKKDAQQKSAGDKK